MCDICVYMCIYVNMCVYMCIYVCIYVYIYVYMCINVYICVYTRNAPKPPGLPRNLPLAPKSFWGGEWGCPEMSQTHIS